VKSSALRFGAIALVLGAAAAVGWVATRGGTTPAKYRLATVERGPLQSVVAASGTLNAVTTVQVGSQISGQISEIAADFNTPVKKGQVIARIDPSSFELRVQQARADLDAARSAVMVARSTLAAQQAELARVQVQLAEAERDHQRKKLLVEKNFLSAAELDKARTVLEATREQRRAVEAQIRVVEAQVASAQAAVAQREALLRQAEVDLERTYIRAPVDGTVILRNVDAGQTVAASLQAPVLFTIARDLRDMQVEAAIDEADVGRLRVGQRATFTVDAFPGRRYEGEIRQIRKAPQSLQNVVSYTVVISASNPDLSLLPGMTANVRVVTDRRDDVLRIPNAALRFRPPADAPESRAADERGVAAAQEFQRRVLEELKPDAEQRAQLESLFAQARARAAAAREAKDEAERRRQRERVRSDLHERIAALLRPEQRPAYERLLAALGARSATGSSARVWVPGPDGRPLPVEIGTGLSDGTSTEVLAGPLKEGDQVIVGLAEAGAARKARGLPGPRPL